MDADKKFIISTIVITLVILLGAVFWASSQSPRVTSNTVVSQETLVDDRGYNVNGNSQAQVTVVEFSDPQCPACAAAASDVETILHEYQGQIKFVYRHFPLPMHAQAVPAAHAVEAAGRQGKFLSMLEAIFSNQDRLKEGDSLFEEIAGSLDLNLEQFNNDRKSNDIANIIKHDAEAATKIGITATPTFFVNGRTIDSQSNQPRIDLLRQAINSALSSSSGTQANPTVATSSAQEKTATPSAK